MSDAIAERFKAETAGHLMITLHDDGLYRHLRFRKHRECNDGEYRPGSSFYWFDLITWPDCLTINGDCGTFAFARNTDMFEFFRGTRINPGYWAEKVRGPVRLKSYSEDLFRQLVTEHFVDAVKYGAAPRGLGKAVRAEILDSDELYYEAGARQALERFAFYKNEMDRWSFRKKPLFKFRDTYEWDFQDYDWTFLWCCHAIQWGIAQYDASKVAASV